MKKDRKQLILKLILSAAGLVAVFFLGKGLSYLRYGDSGALEEGQEETDGMLPLPKAALTEEELEALQHPLQKKGKKRKVQAISWRKKEKAERMHRRKRRKIPRRAGRSILIT